MKSQCFVDDPDEWKTQAAANQLELIDLKPETDFNNITWVFSYRADKRDTIAQMWSQDLVTSTTN